MMNTDDFKRCITPLMERYTGQLEAEFCVLNIDGMNVRLALMKVEHALWVTVMYCLEPELFKDNATEQIHTDMLKNNYLMALNSTMPTSFGLDPQTGKPVLSQRMDWTGCAPFLVQEHIVSTVKRLLDRRHS